MQTFLVGFYQLLAAHPGIAAAAIAAVLVGAMIRAVLSSSYRYR